MLTVTENGVKIALETNASANPLLPLIMAMAILLFMVGVALVWGFLSVRASIGALAVIAVMSYIWRYVKQKSEIPVITGGQVLLSAYRIEHQGLTGKKVYQIQADDVIQIHQNHLTILSKNKPKLVITGFSQNQHIAISQSVLQGKQIQTQGKAIKMQSN